eukprot:GDKI01017844.1.p1 GENE.GDKI01017844.1~~GDKI01017844.1.p1  ORF type:complete len:102 (-),score=17.81 GDKI01017844.1:223-528(-)
MCLLRDECTQVTQHTKFDHSCMHACKTCVLMQQQSCTHTQDTCTRAQGGLSMSGPHVPKSIPAQKHAHTRTRGVQYTAPTYQNRSLHKNTRTRAHSVGTRL